MTLHDSAAEEKFNETLVRKEAGEHSRKDGREKPTTAGAVVAKMGMSSLDFYKEPVHESSPNDANAAALFLAMVFWVFFWRRCIEKRAHGSDGL